MSGCCPLLYLLSVLLFSESVPLHHTLQSKLSITKPQEPPTIRHREDQVSNPQATPPHQTSSGTAKDTDTVLHQQNARLQQEVTSLQQTNAHLKQDHQQEVTHLQQETRQLQSKLDQQPKLGSDTDISFWVVSHNEVRPTGQVLGEGGWGRVVVGSF